MEDQTRFTHSQDDYFAITKRFSIVQLCAVLVKLPPAVQLKQLNAHARSVCNCSRSLSQRLSKDAKGIRKLLIISTCICLKHYVRPPLLAR